MSEEGFFCHSERFQQSESIDGLLAYLLNHTATAQPRGGTNIIVVSPPPDGQTLSFFISYIGILDLWSRVWMSQFHCTSALGCKKWLSRRIHLCTLTGTVTNVDSTMGQRETSYDCSRSAFIRTLNEFVINSAVTLLSGTSQITTQHITLMTLCLFDIHAQSPLGDVVCLWCCTLLSRLSQSLSRYTNDLSLIVTCYIKVFHSDFWEFVSEHALFKDWQQDTRENGAGEATSGKCIFFKSWDLERAHAVVCWRPVRKYSCWRSRTCGQYSV